MAKDIKVTEIYKLDKGKPVKLPFMESKIAAGFPSPAADYLEQKLDLNEYLIKHPASTFVIRVTGSSMIDEGIFDGDLLIVDKSIEPQMGQVVIAELNGGFTVKKIEKINDKLFLVAGNKNYEPIPVNEETEFLIWGVVTYSIHKQG